MSTPILEMKNITKTFPGVKALSNVSFRVAPGRDPLPGGRERRREIHPHEGPERRLPPRQLHAATSCSTEGAGFRGIRDSEKAGIAIIYQELALVPEMTVYENIFLGHEIRKGITSGLERDDPQATEMLGKVRLDVSPAAIVKDLGVGKQQLVEIAKALSRNVKLLILDEPTAALNEDDCDNLLDLMRGLQEQGVTCVLITHKLREVIKVADMVTVLRDGQTICTLDAHKGEVSEARADQAHGRPGDRQHVPAAADAAIDEVVLEVGDWTAYDPARAARS